jgi:hypothetical protein
VLVIYAALDGPVEYAAGPEAGAAAHVHLSAASLDAMARATAESRAGNIPDAPVIVSWNDSVIDPSRAAVGKHLKKFVVLGVPYEIRGDATERVGVGGWSEVGEQYADYLIELMAESSLPELQGRLLAAQCTRRSTSSESSQAPCAARSRTGRWFPTKAAACVLRRTSPAIAHPWKTCTCAGRAPIPALACPWRPVATQRK